MRELDRNPAAYTPAHPPAAPGSAVTPECELGTIAVIGAGRLGRALAAALEAAELDVGGPYARAERPAAADVVLLCVPDTSIAAAARTHAESAAFVGHTSGATSLAALDPVRRAGGSTFGLHPLQTFPGEPADAFRFQGCGCAVAGTDEAALSTAGALAGALGMNAFVIDDRDRLAYHAAASIASNFLITLEAAAEAVAAGAGIDAATVRAALAPLVRASVENWAELGPGAALTGPVARADEQTIAGQQAAVAEVAPQLSGLYGALLAQTRRLVAEGSL